MYCVSALHQKRLPTRILSLPTYNLVVSVSFSPCSHTGSRLLLLRRTRYGSIACTPGRETSPPCVWVLIPSLFLGTCLRMLCYSVCHTLLYIYVPHSYALYTCQVTRHIMCLVVTVTDRFSASISCNTLQLSSKSLSGDEVIVYALVAEPQ